MFVTSAQRLTMSGQEQIPDVERQNLLDRLLDAVKQCQVRFGGKTELATDGDSRVTCLLTQFEAVLQHGLKRARSRISAFRQVGQATGIVKLPPDSVIWSFVKEHLSKLDVERFLSLEKATTDAGRGRAWLRSALNEHSLERYIHYMLQNKLLLSQFYEKDAFMMDEERASMLPMMAADLALAGLSSILFALTVDCEDLNIVRQVSASTLNREVFSNILPSFPQKPAEEPLAVYSSVLSTTEDSREEKRKKKKKKKRVQAAIVAIEEDENSLASQKDTAKNLPLSDSSVNGSEKTHTRSSSYPGEITVNLEGYPGKTALIDGKEVLFTEITKSISLPDNSVAEIEVDKSELEKMELDIERFEETSTEPRYEARGAGGEEIVTTGERRNFVFGAVDLFQREAKLRENESPFTEHRETNSLNTQTEFTSKVVDSYIMDSKNDDSLKIENTAGSQSFTGTKSTSATEKEVSAATGKPSLDITNTFQESFSDDFSKLNVFSVNDIANSPKFDDDHRFQDTGNIYSHSSTNQQKDNEDTKELDTEGELSGELDEQMSSSELQEMTHEPVVLLDSGESLVPVMEGEISAKDRPQPTFDNTSDFLAEKDRDSASLSSASWSCIEEGEELSEAKDEFTSLSTSCDTTTAAAALEVCSVAQRGMAHMNRGFNTTEKADKAVSQESLNKHEGVSAGELKQAIVSMMLKKDEIEEQNRNLDNLLNEQRKKSDQLQSEVDVLRDQMKQQENRQSTQIGSLSRENELLKHQLKKYVGAVQALRSDLHGKSSEAMEVLSGIRQEEVLPPLPPEKSTEEIRLSEEAEEYRRKLIQVADLHGELMEFNEHLHKQLGFYQYQVRRLREELIHLRGPLPEDSEIPDDATNSSDFDPAVMSVGSRPLVNVWIPSVFLRGRSSSVHHVYQVYVRIKDDEWNIYRRYSQFLELHKNLRRRYAIVDHFKFPPKKTLGNKDSQFVEERRRLLQDYLRRVINLYATSNQELSCTTIKPTLIQILPFFGDPYPPEKTQKESKPRKKRSAHYTGL